MEPQNVQAMLQMQQAMQQLQSSGVMPAGSMPGLGAGLGGPLGGGAGQPSGICQVILDYIPLAQGLLWPLIAKVTCSELWGTGLSCFTAMTAHTPGHVIARDAVLEGDVNALKESPHWLCCAKHRIRRLDPTVAPLQRTRKISAHSWTAWALGQAAALEALGHWALEHQRSLTQKPPMLLSWSSCRWSITHSKRQTAVLVMHACLLALPWDLFVFHALLSKLPCRTSLHALVCAEHGLLRQAGQHSGAASNRR